MNVLIPVLIVVATVAGMEAVAWGTHRYVMHGWGWGWHRSHHEPHDDLLEKNDLFALVFAGLSIVLIAIGTGTTLWWLTWIGAGMAAYGFLYFVVHDGLVHQRWPFRYIPRRGYLKRLVQAHRLHHAVEGREGCVSFGFLYAPPVRKLKDDLRTRGALAEGEDRAA
jgi:beta-carotene 3-hydroxylase